MRSSAGVAGIAAFALLSAYAAAPPSALAQSYEEGYRRGFEDGFSAGQRAAEQKPAAIPPGGPGTVNRGIIVIRAGYGDGRRECMLTGQMAGYMNGRMSAQLEVTNTLCGDPAPGQRKSLTLEYTCGGAAKRASAYEHRTLYVSCP